MSYTPPQGDNVDFELQAYSPPEGDSIDFELEDEPVTRKSPLFMGAGL